MTGRSEERAQGESRGGRWVLGAIVLVALATHSLGAPAVGPREGGAGPPLAGSAFGSPAPPRSEAATPRPPSSRLVSHAATFTLSDVTLAIEDLHMSTHLDDVARASAAAAVINGGFFDPEGEPLGLAVSSGVRLAPLRPALSGGVLWIRDGVAHLSATEDYRESVVDFAIQCRPRLVVGSHVNIRSDDGRRAERTAICLQDGGKTVEVLIAENAGTGPTLFQLAQELQSSGCEEALNLDGGPSTG